MEFLKAEIAQKRKAVQDSRFEGPASKYMRRGEEEQIRIRMDQDEKEKLLALAEAKLEAIQRDTSGKSSSRAGSSKGGTPTPGTPNVPPTTDDTANSNPGAAFNISNEETIRRLRSKGQPIRLFGEADKDRRLRLRALELIEERGGHDRAGLNDFRKALEDVEEGERRAEDAAAKAKSNAKADGAGGVSGAGSGAGAEESKEEGLGRPLDLGLVKSDPNKLYPLIYHALKRTLKEWGEWLDERPDSVKRTMAGKLAAANQVRTIDYMKPLFKALRARDLGDIDKLARITEIVHYMQAREYQRANDAYLRLSIGTSAWPIGVTMVGIHERSAREKISSDQVAHVLNDEVSRKYIQSLKRLLTFAQTKYPPEDISQLMG